MPGETFAWLVRLKEVEREHTSTRWATDHLLRSIQEGAVRLEQNLKRGDITRASNRLEATYVIRLFSEFELGLKRFLKAKGKKPPKNASQLIDRVASLVGFAGTFLTNAHKVRRYRNKLVHNLDEEVESLALRKATSIICTYMDRLQPHW